MKRKLLLFGILIMALSFSNVLHAADWYVNSSSGNDGNDGSAGSPWATISHALDQASGGDTISISGTFTGEGMDTIGINISKDITIIGEGADLTFVQASATAEDGSVNQRIFTIDSSITVTLQDMTIRNGYVQLSSGNDGGAGIKTHGSLNMISCIITDNHVHSTTNSAGGGILSTGEGNITIDKSTISENSCHSFGGGIAILGTVPRSTGKLVITNSAIHDNIVANHQVYGLKVSKKDAKRRASLRSSLGRS